MRSILIYKTFKIWNVLYSNQMDDVIILNYKACVHMFYKFILQRMKIYFSFQVMNISKIWRTKHGSILLKCVHHFTCYQVTVWYIIMSILQEREHTGYLILDDGFKAHVSSNIDYQASSNNFNVCHICFS